LPLPGRGRNQAVLEGKNGEGGIRTLGDVAATPVFETVSDYPQAIVNSDVSANDSRVLASCLALLAEKSPDLALVAER
jgi:hypothetical protein